MKLQLAAVAGLSLVALLATGLAGFGSDDPPTVATESSAATAGSGAESPSGTSPGSSVDRAQSVEGGAEAATGLGGGVASGPELRPLPPADGIPEPIDPGAAPVAMRIPALDVLDSPIQPVGVEPNGEFEVPIASEVGWYRFGSGPGDTGSTVMAAHIAYDGEDGVFRYLSTIEPGALVEVDLDDGSTIVYEIVERAEYDKTELPFADIFNEAGPDRLVLITCGGEFNPQLRSYESNVVAYAEPLG
ncbi:MAG: class F sortase [Acidimicrobiia bacterium]|nr:class F sortase [Acidimicrobiia bacterium]